MNGYELIFRLCVLSTGTILAFGGYPFLSGLLLIGSLVGYIRR